MTNDVVPEPVAELDYWWGQLRAAALVGTARRAVPDLPPLGVAERSDASREQRLLDAAALGDAVRRAGRLAEAAPDPDEPAPAEEREVAPARAVQVLELLLTQGPVSGATRDRLTRHWLEAAESAQRLVPPRLLPTLLELGSSSQEPLRRSLRPTLGARGAWLAARNPDWAWAVEARQDPAAAPQNRTEAVAAARRVDPAAGRALVEDSWSTDRARDRADALAGLAVGLGPADEPFLEACLDDRAKGVRELAAQLLGRLPDSARAARMAERLRPLVAVRGTLRRTIDVELADDPDPAAVRDGLVDPGPHGSRRVRWLHQLVSGAPLSFWTDLVGDGPERVVGMLRGDNAATVLDGLRDAAAARRDLTWAEALLATRWETRLVALLPWQQREELLVRRLRGTALPTVAHELVQLPTPWGPDLSAAVVAAIARQKDRHVVSVLRDTLVVALHPSVMPSVERVVKSAADDDALGRSLRDVLQFQSLHHTISEAFR